MNISGCTALVTGANQGIGKGFVEVLLEAGARRVYATARRPETLAEIVALDPGRITALELEVNTPEHRTQVAAQARDVNLLINNAGIHGQAGLEERRFLSASNLDEARLILETNCFAPAEMCRALAPALIANGPSAIINILSMGALFCAPNHAFYCMSKAAAAIMTQGVRAELAGRGVLVAGVFTNTVESRMSANTSGPKMTAVDHARQVFAAVEAGVEDIYAGAGAPEKAAEILADPKAFERKMIEGFLASAY